MSRFFPPFVSGPRAVAFLILRLVSGIALMHHGWGKIQNPFGWMGTDSGIPGIFQAMAALSEFGGGLALVLGLLTPLASLGIWFTMLYATVKVHVMGGDPFVAPRGWEGGSYELALTFWAIALLFMLSGPGKLSLDWLLFGRRAERKASDADATTP